MSFRPTISIYLDDHIIDCGYYKNWEEHDLLLECCHLARKLDGCTSRRDVMERLGRTYGVEEWDKGERHAFYMSFEQYPEEERIHDSHVAERLHTFDEPASYTEDENLLHDVERPSEFPVFIDLTDRCFYYSFEGLKTDAEPGPVKGIQEYDAAKDGSGWLSDGSRISFDLVEHIEATSDGDRQDGFRHAEESQQMIDAVATLFGGALGEPAERSESDPERQEALAEEEKKAVRDLIAQGWDSMRSLRADEAIGAFREAIERQSSVSDGSGRALHTVAQAHEGLASSLYFSDKQHEEALAHFGTATELYRALNEEYEADFREDIARCQMLGAKAAFLSYKFPESFQKFADASLGLVELADEDNEWAANMLEECLDDMVERSAFLRHRLWSSLSELHPGNERFREQAERANVAFEQITTKEPEGNA